MGRDSTCCRQRAIAAHVERFTHILLFRALYLVRTGLCLAYDDKKGLENDDKKGLENGKTRRNSYEPLPIKKKKDGEKVVGNKKMRKFVTYKQLDQERTFHYGQLHTI